MQIEILVVGNLQANCYLVTKNNKTIIIDPGDEKDKIINACQNKNVVGILITHYHFDHVTALADIEKYFQIKSSDNATGFNIERINTPGHTKDSVTYYFPDDKVMFTGDFLFKGTIGRMDLPTGSIVDMKNSLELISKYPCDTKIYPGHGESSILGNETKYFDLYMN